MQSRIPRNLMIAAAAALVFLGAGCGAATSTSTSATAQAAPKVITIGTLYAGSGNFAASSQPEYSGLKFWAAQANANGGVFVKAYGKKIHVKLIAYDDQSDTSTAASLYTQLITQDKVNILVSDFGSVLTSVAVPIAQENKILLFDQTGSGTSLFSASNPYIVDTSIPTSGLWPTPLAQFLISKNVKRVAIIYAANDFTGSQATTLAQLLKAANITPVFDQSVPTTTNDYTVLIHSIAAQHPGAVVELGYDANDIAFFHNLVATGTNFPMLFAIYPGLETSLLQKTVGLSELKYVYTYASPPLLQYNNVSFGLGINDFLSRYTAATQQQANFQTIAGYNTGLVIEKTLATSSSLKQLDLRHAAAALSGKFSTLEGTFSIAADGSQVGEQMYLAQFLPVNGKTQLTVVYPSSHATAQPVYPAP